MDEGSEDMDEGSEGLGHLEGVGPSLSELLHRGRPLVPLKGGPFKRSFGLNGGKEPQINCQKWYANPIAGCDMIYRRPTVKSNGAFFSPKFVELKICPRYCTRKSQLGLS